MPELLIGCGNQRLKRLSVNTDYEWEGLVTLDHDPDCKPDVLHDLEVFPYPFEDNTFDTISAFHVLEHVGRQGDWRFFFTQWTELWRIAKPECLFFGIVPMWNTSWMWGDPSHSRVIQMETLTFLDQDSYRNVGISPMSDFRHFYKASWKTMHHSQQGDEFAFCLKAVKNG